jgi:hypothetical protein
MADIIKLIHYRKSGRITAPAGQVWPSSTSFARRCAYNRLSFTSWTKISSGTAASFYQRED